MLQRIFYELLTRKREREKEKFLEYVQKLNSVGIVIAEGLRFQRERSVVTQFQFLHVRHVPRSYKRKTVTYPRDKYLGG
jgi:hypothetical protein